MEITLKKTTETKVDIQLPYFTTNELWSHMVIDDKTLICVKHSSSTKAIEVTNYGIIDSVFDQERNMPCSAEKFNEKYNEALNQLINLNK